MFFEYCGFKAFNVNINWAVVLMPMIMSVILLNFLPV